MAGIANKTYYNWREWGEAGKEPYAEFLQVLKRAEAKAQLDLVRNMKANPKCWTMYMTIAERRWPKLWGRSDRIEHDVKGDLSVSRNYDMLKQLLQNPEARELTESLFAKLG